ncbi:MAG: ATP-binding cassette domain-containing protein, partial [Simkania sp.]|nr:ATP-binding cassette domain-containing protein [Simkania sp.]
ILGIIGSNGSGKSTLLRIIASIYSYQEGSITSKGKIRSMIGLETGLRRLLTVKNNIYLISSLFGLSLKEIKQSYQSILSFSELEEYEQYPFYQLSAGMKQKLAFSIAAHSKADILLLDEVFTFGDEAFREKSIAKLKQLVKKGMSIIFVSHELELIKKHADRVLWIDRGQLVKEGTPEETVQAYLKK